MSNTSLDDIYITLRKDVLHQMKTLETKPSNLIDTSLTVIKLLFSYSKLSNEQKHNLAKKVIIEVLPVPIDESLIDEVIHTLVKSVKTVQKKCPLYCCC